MTSTSTAMTSTSKSPRLVIVVWLIIVALVLPASATMIHAQDGEEELTFDELQEQRELAAQQLADAAASIDATTATIDELATALDEVAGVAAIQEIRLEDATNRYASALDRRNRAEESHDEVLTQIEDLQALVVELSLAQFTGESGREVLEVALSTDPGQSSRLAHLLRLQTRSAQDAMDELSGLELLAAELVAERSAASAVAEESLLEMQRRSDALDTSIGQQEKFLQAAELRLATSESDAEAAAALIEETEERLLNYVRGIGAPAPVDRADIVTISFYEGSDSQAIFQIQVHKDIEEQTRGLYQLAFSQGINLGGWGFRTTNRQIELRRAHCGETDYDIWLKPANECSPPTARPGYSKHEQGRAIDFQWNGGSIGPRSGAPFQWLAANAPQFGFVNLPSEPWHWSDGTATTFDPTVPLPDIPDDAVPEAEPDEATIELLTAPLDEEFDGDANGVVVIEEVVVDVAGADADAELAETELAETDETIVPEVLGESLDATGDAEPPPAEAASDAGPATVEPAIDEPVPAEPVATLTADEQTSVEELEGEPSGETS